MRPLLCTMLRRSGRCCPHSGKLNSHAMRVFPNLRTSAVAIATIIAMLLVPACGSLCATMTHCSTSAASAYSEACHHANMSGQSEALSLSSQSSCGQRTPLVAILTVSESSFQLPSVDTVIAASPISAPHHTSTLDSHCYESLHSNESPQNPVPLENLSILRI
jgi:hypothetical protein